MVTLQSWTANTQGLTAVSALASDDQFRVVQGGVSKKLTAAVLLAYISATVGLTVGAATISGGTSGNILYNNAGVLGELATTGSGNVVRATSPTLVTPALGTPSALVLTNATGLPATALIADTTTAVGFGSINLGHASDTTLTRVSAGVVAIEGVTVLTTATGQPLDADLTSWAAITRASGFDTFVSTPSSANLRTLVTDETGSGALVFGTSPSIATPTFTGAVSLTGGTVNGTLLSMTQTWSGTGTYTGILYNVTDSGPSNAASLLIDAQVAGSSKFNVTKGGNVRAADGNDAAPGYAFTSSTNSGISLQGGQVAITQGGTLRAYFSASGNFVLPSGALALLSNTGTLLLGATSDVVLARDAANTLALRNSTNAQTFNVYSTFTDLSNYVRFNITAGDTTYLINSGAGTGAGNKKIFIGGTNGIDLGDSAGAVKWSMSSAFHWVTAIDNTYDIGASGATRPRTGFFGTSIVAPIHTITQGTISGDAPQLNGTVTWNSAGTTFTAWKLNVTDTASAAASLLIDLQKAGTSQFKVDKSGNIIGALGNTGAVVGGLVVGFGSVSTVNMAGGQIQLYEAGSLRFRWTDTTSDMYASASLNWSSTSGAGGTPDVRLYRDAANTLALRNSTNAQIFNIYNTYTDVSNHEEVFVGWLSNVAFLRTSASGTGIATREFRIGTGGTGVLSLQTNSTTRFQVDGSGNLIAGADNTYDIGASGATRPRNIYIGSQGFFGSSVTVSGSVNTSTSGIVAPSGDNIFLRNNAGSGGATVVFGNAASSSFPALKRSGTDLQVRLADDSGYAGLQLGTASSALKVGTHSAIAAETVTGYITIKDSAGTDRKIAVVS